MGVRMLPMVLMLCALTVGLLGAYTVSYERSFVKKAVKAKAKIVTYSYVGENGRKVPVVEFTAKEDGKLIRKPAQAAGSMKLGDRDEVDILYTRKKVLGMDAWNIFIIKDEGAHPYRVYTYIGSIACIVAAILAAAAVAVWMR